MGCGASTDTGNTVQAPSAKAKSSSDVSAAAALQPAPPPPEKIGESGWHLLKYVEDIKQVTQGVTVPQYYLAVHDNKALGMPRLTVIDVFTGCLEKVRIKDKGRGLAIAMDLECLFMIDAKAAGKKQALYVAMTSTGAAWLFKLSYKRRQWVAHGVKSFNVSPPPGESTLKTNCEGARAFVEDGKLFMEYGSRGGCHKGAPVTPWVARTPLDIKAIRKGKFKVDPEALDVTYWPETVDNDRDVRQCADMGQATGMARYGQLFAAAKDDEATETHFKSYIMEHLPGARTGGVENFKPLFRVDGAKIEAIYDISKDVSIFATDDEGKGSFMTILHRHSGLAWKHHVVPPSGEDPRMYGVSGLSPVDKSIKKTKDDSSSESEQSEEEEEEQEEEEQQEEAQQEEGEGFGFGDGDGDRGSDQGGGGGDFE